MFYSHLSQVFSSEYCSQLIEKAEQLGFEAAKVNMYGTQKSQTHIRNNERLEFDDMELAKNITERVLSSFTDFPLELHEKKFRKFGSHFRFYKYQPGQYFKPHKDGHYKEESLESFITCLIYLNTTQGGETILMPQGYAHKDSWILVQPQEGSVLLFEHDFWHEGRPVVSGEKYVLRTDIFFE